MIFNLSPYHRQLVFLLLLYLAFLLFVAFVPPDNINEMIWQGDKVKHLLAFWLYLLLAWAAFPHQPYLKLMAGGLILGGLIEAAQALIPYRQACAYDLLADLAGILLGWATLAATNGFIKGRNAPEGHS
jgi:VanZ family protein